jgi:hypothetical protein
VRTMPAATRRPMTRRTKSAFGDFRDRDPRACLEAGEVEDDARRVIGLPCNAEHGPPKGDDAGNITNRVMIVKRAVWESARRQDRPSRWVSPNGRSTGSSTSTRPPASTRRPGRKRSACRPRSSGRRTRRS